MPADPRAAAERRWLLANFALETNQPREAQTLADAAVRGDPKFQAELPMFQPGTTALAVQVAGRAANP